MKAENYGGPNARPGGPNASKWNIVRVGLGVRCLSHWVTNANAVFSGIWT